MYRYDAVDRTLVAERVAEYRNQTSRFLSGQLSEEEFRPLRLRNGLYVQRHAPMLRIAIPYGVLSAKQMRTLASIARRYDRGYGHFTTRQNIQFNWIRIEDSPDILEELASVEMHAIQTSGNAVRNITSDEFAGVAADELVDPRAFCEILRQWSSFHPEFTWLPRKFKIAINGAREDRAAVAFHDIGLHLTRAPDGALGFRVLVGGGMGRTPIIGTVIREFLPWRHVFDLHRIHSPRLQPARPARQHSQGAHQDPGTRTRHRGVRAPGRGRLCAVRRRPVDGDRRRVASRCQLLRARAVRGARGASARHVGSRVRALGRAQRASAHRVPGYRSVVLSLKTDRHRSRRRNGGTDGRSLPTGPSDTDSARFASRTNRI